MSRHLASLIALLPCLLPIAAHGEGYWDSRFWMAEYSTPTQLATDGDGKLLMAGGHLSLFTPQSSTSVGSWDGHRWTHVYSQQPVALTASQGITWLAGQPATNSVTQVSPAGEASVLPAVAGSVLTLTVDGTGLVAGGQFVAGPDNAATNVARWNGTAWVPLGTGLPGKVIKLSATEGGLFAGIAGTLDQLATVWHWDGVAWSQLGTLAGELKPVRQITALAWHEGRLLASLSNQTGNTNFAVLSWSGGEWQPHGTPTLTGNGNSLAVFQGELYVAGSSLRLDLGTPTFGVARLVSGRWQPLELAPGLRQGRSLALAATRNELFMLSDLPIGLGLTPGSPGTSTSYDGLWQFDGHDWWLHSGGPSAFQIVSDINASPAGIVLTVGGGSATNPSRKGFIWDGFFLKAMGVLPPEPGVILGLWNRMVATPSHLYRQAGRSPASPSGAGLLARLEGTNWVAATTPVSLNMQSATALTAEGETIYISGRDDSVAGTPLGVARWQDGTWQYLGGNFENRTLLALGFAHGQLLAGGSFKTVAGQPITNLAHWDGTAWQPVTPAPDGPISGFARRGDDLVVVGSFKNIGGISARGVALRTATGWQSLADGLGVAAPSTIAVKADGTLAVCGRNPDFQSSEIWLRRGTVWERIGRIIGFEPNAVNSLFWQGQDLHLGGNFYGTDQGESGRFAIWHEASPELTVRRLPNQGNQLHWTGSRAGTPIFERGPSPDQLTPWRTNGPLDLHQHFTNSPSTGSSEEYYRIRITE